MGGDRDTCECGQDHSATNAKLKALFDDVLELMGKHDISGILVSAMVQSEGEHYAVDCGVAFNDQVPLTHRLNAAALLCENADGMLEQMYEDAEEGLSPVKETLQ